MFKGLRSIGASLWILRKLVRVQEQQLAETTRLATAVEKVAAALQVRNAQGFVTGVGDPEDRHDYSGQVRSTDAELAELVYWETELQRQLGRAPTDDEVVAAWESWKESAGAGA